MDNENGSGFKYRGINSDVVDSARWLRILGGSLPRVTMDDGASHLIDGVGPWQRQTTGALRALLIPFSNGGPQLFVERHYPDGEPHIIDANGKRLGLSELSSYSTNSIRSGEEMESVLRKIEAEQQPYDICGADGKKCCSITYDPLSGDIFRIQTVPYENKEQEAEHSDELICVTGEDGALTGEQMTRGEARENSRRYLVVSLLLRHQGTICVAQRSKEKKIDPGKEGISAHGVAKLLFHPDGTPITDIRYAALVNTALELNEELRHGNQTTPFHVIVWPGSERELLMYMHEHPMDDPNTVYLTGGMVFADHGYPLYEWKIPRTRFVISGHVFAESKPEIVIDPNEVTESRWLTMKEFAKQPNVSGDGLTCAEESYRSFLESRTRWGFAHSQRWVQNAINDVFHPEIPFMPRDD